MSARGYAPYGTSGAPQLPVVMGLDLDECVDNRLRQGALTVKTAWAVVIVDHHRLPIQRTEPMPKSVADLGGAFRDAGDAAHHSIRSSSNLSEINISPRMHVSCSLDSLD